MVARLVLSTDVIDVTNPPVLLFGQPGVGKSSLAQTAPKTLTLDFDGGIHRSAFRKDALRFETWKEMIEVQRNGVKDDHGTTVIGPNFGGYDTIVLDTIGTLLTMMSTSIIADSSKAGTRTGGLTIQGWGALKTLFEQWLTGLRQAGKQVIMIAHQKEEKEGEEKVMRPDIAGGSYGIVMNSADIVGYMMYSNNVRSIYWEPTDRFFAKNGGRLKSGPIPDFAKVPDFMSQLLVEAKKNLGSTADASAKLAAEVGKWKTLLDPETCNLSILNDSLDDFIPIGPGPLKTQVWSMMTTLKDKYGLVYNATAKRFEEKAV